MEYLVSHRRGKGVAEYSPGMTFPVYRIIAPDADAAKRTACRLDKKPSVFFRNYNAIPVRTKKKRPALAGAKRLTATKGSSIAGGLETKNSISHARESIKRGRWF